MIYCSEFASDRGHGKAGSRLICLSLKYAAGEQDTSEQDRTGQPQHETPENVQGDSNPLKSIASRREKTI